MTFSIELLVTGLVKNILSPRTWAWLAATLLVLYGVHQNSEHNWLGVLVICWCIISVFFIGGKAFADALNVMVKDRMDIDVKLGK